MRQAQTLKIILITTLAIVTVLVGFSNNAFAGTFSSSKVGATDGDNTVQVTVTTSLSSTGTTYPGRSSQQYSGYSPCQWVEVPSSFLLNLGLTPPSSSSSGSHLVVDYITCPTVTEFDEAVGEGGYQVAPTSGFFWYKVISNVPPKPCVSCAVHQALEQASAQIPTPEIQIAPNTVGGISPATIVNLPTWLWISGAVWHPVSASVTVGGLTASVVAQPTSVTWSMGNGALLNCNGPGTPYNYYISAELQQTNCSYTYTNVFTDSVVNLTAIIHWTVTWSATNGDSGSLSPLSTQSTIPVHIEQIESIITAG